MKRLLVIQMARLGDLLQTMPFLARLRAAYPEAWLGVLTDRIGMEVLAGHPAVNQVVPFDLALLHNRLARGSWTAYHKVRQFIENQRQRPYDLIFNLNFSPLTLLLTYLLKPPLVRGYQPAARGRSFIRDPWLTYIYSLVHARQFNRVNLADVFRHLAPPPPEGENGERGKGQKAEPQRECSLSFSEPLLVALQLGSRHIRRRWPVTYYADLGRWLIREYGATVVLLGVKEEGPLGETFLAALTPAARERVVNLQGRTSLVTLKEWLQQARLLVTGDTGTMHLAAAIGTPVLALFMGPALCFETGPYGQGHYVLQAEPRCHPCTEADARCRSAECRQMITPEMVATVISSRIFGSPSQALDSAAFPGVQLYRGTFDSLGLSYQPQLPRPWSFTGLVAQAYREAGKVLLGIEPEELAKNGCGFLPTGAEREVLFAGLGKFLAALRHWPFGEAMPSERREALLPLWAWQQEMERQAHLLPGSDQGQRDSWERNFWRIRDCLMTRLERWLSQ